MDIIKKKLTTEMLQDWYILDNILFGGNPKYYMSENSDYKDYLLLKKTYLSTLFEYYNHINYKSRFTSLPKNAKQLRLESCNICDRYESECLSEMRKNRKKISAFVSEGLTMKTSGKINDRLSLIKTNMLFDKCFMEHANSNCLRKSNIDDVKGILLNNCLTEAKKELIKYSIKYYPYF